MTSFHCTSLTHFLLCYILISTKLNTIHATNIATTTDSEYASQTINCTLNEACYILCQHTDSCLSTTINCAPDYPCQVTCSANSACDTATIHAEFSSIFKLLNCNDGTWTCIGMTLYLPPNMHGEKRAFLLGADRGFSAGTSSAKPLQFYAIYGWNDVNITVDANRFTFANQAGTMHCTIYYNITCAFKSDGWECANPTDICNNPPTSSPTINPTAYPTIQPTIHPTIYPTIQPTIHPTIYPTIYPTVYPTYIPSVYPTINPTTMPTKYPTTNPTAVPTTAFPTTSIPTTATPTTSSPTFTPITSAPTYEPTVYPTSIPTISPTKIPTFSPIPTTSQPSPIPPSNPSQFPSASPTLQLHTSTAGTTEVDGIGDLNSSKKSSVDPVMLLIIGLLLLLICVLVLLFWFCRRTRRVQQELNHKFTETQAEVQNLKRESVHTMSRKETTNNPYVIPKAADSPPTDLKAIKNLPNSGDTESSTSSSHAFHATFDLIKDITEGDPNEDTDVNINMSNKVNMMLELTALKTRSNPSSGFSPTSVMSTLSGIPSTAPVTAMDKVVELSGMDSELHITSDVDSPFPDKDSVGVVRQHYDHIHMPQKSTQHGLELTNLNRPVTAPAPPWSVQPAVDLPDVPTLSSALSNDAWEEQMNALKQQWIHIQSSRPCSANFTAMAGSLPTNKKKVSFFEDDDVDRQESIYANMPMSAPVMDHNIFFNNMLHKYTTTANPQTATALMQQHKIGTRVKVGSNVQPPTLLNIPTNKSVASNNDDVASNLSSALSYLSGVPGHIQTVQPYKMKTTDNDLSVIWNGTEKSEYTATQTPDMFDADNKSDSASSTPSHSQMSHTDTMSGEYAMPSKIPSVMTIGNKTEHTDAYNSDSDHDSEYSTSVTMTMSVGSQSLQIVDPNEANMISRHFRIPSVITDKGLSDAEDSTDLPSLIQIDEDIQVHGFRDMQLDDVKGQFREEMDVLAEHDEDDESEMTIELQLDDNEATQTLREETEEYTDSMDDASEDTLLTRESKEEDDNYNDGLSSHIGSDGDGDGSDIGGGFEQYGSRLTRLSTEHSGDTRSSVSVSETVSQTQTDYKGSIVINDDDLMDDDFDDMLHVTDDEIIGSFNDNNYENDEEEDDDGDYYDNDDYED